MKKRLVFISIFLSLMMLLFISCTEKKSSDTNLIETDSYTVLISDNINATKQLNGEVVVFSIDGKSIGGLDTFIYYPDQPEYQLDPNHSLVVSSKKLKNMKYDVLEKNYDMYPPAASGDTTKTNVTHLFFIFKDKKVYYDLYFDTSAVDETAILEIGKSFKLK